MSDALVASPGGVCSRCGGPVWWTEVRGEMWVACQAECTDVQGDLFGRNPPIVSLCDEPEETPKARKRELSMEEGVVPLEGGATRANERSISEPPVGWLSSMWLGGPSWHEAEE